MKIISIRAGIIWLIILSLGVLILYLIFCTNKNTKPTNIETSDIEDVNTLLSIQNLDKFYQQDKSRDLELISEKKTYDKKVKSIKVYRFSTTYQKDLLEQELFFDFKGKLLKSAYYSSESSDTSFNYIFYNDKGKIFLDVAIGSNKYDTTYTLRNFNNHNLIKEKIQYNIKRKELDHYETRNLKLLSDSVLRIEETHYAHNSTTNNILPYYILDMNLILTRQSEVKAHIHRTVCQDTVRNSESEELFRLEDHGLISEKNKIQFEYNQQGDWVVMKGEGFLIKREINFYDDTDTEIRKGFIYSTKVLVMLDSIMQTLASHAWKNHNEKNNELAYKTKLFKDGNYGKRIELQEAVAINDFTPELWYMVNYDSGFIAGIKGACVVVGYNTPLKDDMGFNRRCLAVYEKANNVYKLRKESLTALESFNDYEEDFSFHDFNEANFSVGIEDGEIVVSYSYMRGEASYSYAYQNGDWVLDAYESSHRTCCQAKMYSYDYKTKTYSSSIYSTTEDDSEDTSFTVQQNRKIVFMDSMNVMQIDYKETGLLVK
ncbi:MAG: hypothetical protein H7259_04550 [Cytophagales bacterium]|nr:hypothetical protein [Cytophaga sp.]